MRPPPAMRAHLALALLAGMCLAGCITARDKSNQLSRVAKDWCLTIRASQVIPVYPLTRDIRPGDVFLTTTPIGEEIALFESKGFLPLDLHLVRLNTDDALRAFYATRLGELDKFPGPVSTWDDLPASAFPTYSFEISRSGGLNLAIPVQGVPVAFSYLGAAAATGTVTLSRAQTVGLDMDTLRPLLARWEKDNQGLLAAYATDPGDHDAHPVYVRIVSRVYRVSAVAVSLNDAARSGAEAAAGLELPRPEAGTPSATRTAAEQYDDIASKLNATLHTQLGGKVRVINVSRRSVTMAEEFPAPMAIGYLAYDCRVLQGGVLSAPVPAYQRLTGSVVAPGVLNSAALVQAWYTADEAARVPRIKEWMEKNLGPPEQRPSIPDFLAQPKWDPERRRMIRDLGMVAR